MPLGPRQKVRLARAIVFALQSSQRSMPTVRKVVVLITAPLRACGLTDEEIEAQLTAVIEEVALSHGLGATSLLSGKPRWRELSDRLVEWIALTDRADGV